MSDPHGEPRKGLVFNNDWRTYISKEATLTPEECDRVLRHRGELKTGTVRTNEARESLRDSGICWIRYAEDTAWLFRRIKPVLLSANKRFFSFKLTGFTEPLQYTEYGPGQHYDWHLDLGKGPLSMRKLSFVVQLSDPADYDGGVLQVRAMRDPDDLPRDRGRIVIFPSYMLHRVTPVTRGLRRSLVGWVGGPPFR